MDITAGLLSVQGTKYAQLTLLLLQHFLITWPEEGDSKDACAG